VDYLAERDAGKPPDQRGSYRVVEDTMTITGKRKADPVLQVRRVLVWSSPKLRGLRGVAVGLISRNGVRHP
jgi:hypothetical protein